jgi:hypothetical protein
MFELLKDPILRAKYEQEWLLMTFRILISFWPMINSREEESNLGGV